MGLNATSSFGTTRAIVWLEECQRASYMYRSTEPTQSVPLITVVTSKSSPSMCGTERMQVFRLSPCPCIGTGSNASLRVSSSLPSLTHRPSQYPIPHPLNAWLLRLLAWRIHVASLCSATCGLGNPRLPKYTMIRRVSMALRDLDSARTDEALLLQSRETFHGPFLAPLRANFGYC